MKYLSPNLKTYLEKATEYPCPLRLGDLDSSLASPETFVSETGGFQNTQMGSLHGSSILPTFYWSRSPWETEFTHQMVSNEE